ncbi:hypothetical protein AB1Y20_010716 [Prymnesium parvum]|uniref:J domain-containing protein n=1 Tax=Prymnesium parvum TaxID=97485 RepID=A0AB34IS65_PRYPA
MAACSRPTPEPTSPHADTSPHHDSSPRSSASEPGWGSVLGGVALVGAAAGYAALAFTFRRVGTSSAGRYNAAAADLSLSEAVSREWERGSFETRFRAATAEFERAHAAFEEQMHRRQSSGQFGASAEHWKHKFEEHSTAGGSNTHVTDWAYEELGIPRSKQAGATIEEIKVAYRNRALKTHPDAGGDSAAFKRVTHALEAIFADRRARSKS